jgi:hypothetical protein
MKLSIKNIKINILKNQNEAILEHLSNLGIQKDILKNIIWQKKSIDSRKKSDIYFIYNIEVETSKNIKINNNNIEILTPSVSIKRKSKNLNGKIAVIGTGPAGLFAALRLCQYGYKPFIFERGKEIEERDKDINIFNLTGKINPNSNIQFGEGGAGTYSDGKLNTRVKSEYIQNVFEEFVKNGAQKEILYDYKPHIGTDILKKVVVNLREKIKKMGGTFLFEHHISDFKILDNKIKSIEINNKYYEEFDHIILASGHSARDTYKKLNDVKVAMESKDFAIGVRIEHPRIDIDKMQYGKYAGHPNLGAATYNFTYNNPIEKRGVFTFCMCPGGEIVNASSEVNQSVVNGMSYSHRNGEFSNSAVVVALRKEDFGNELFDAMDFQEKIEKNAYKIIGQHGALYQNLKDFMNNKDSKYIAKSSYKMKLHSYNLNSFFPDVIGRNLKLAFNYWSKNKYFVSKNANLIGPETRTSSPLRIKRDAEGRSINISNLYPIGEGAGYAGGITSAAVDGLKIVDSIFAEIVEV